MGKLVKETITTTTERFHDDGTVKERVVEQREKVYDNQYSEQEIQEATEIEETEPKAKEDNASEKQEEEVENPLPKEDLVREAAAKIDKQKKNPPLPPGQPAPPTGYTPVGAVSPLPQYNVVGRQSNTQTPTFPWEQPQY